MRLNTSGNIDKIDTFKGYHFSSGDIVLYQSDSTKTCFIFNELQDCPNARSSLKYFALGGRFDAICTSSLLGIKNYRSTKKPFRGIPVGFEDYLSMKPMDFEEFL